MAAAAVVGSASSESRCEEIRGEMKKWKVYDMKEVNKHTGEDGGSIWVTYEVSDISILYLQHCRCE